MPMRPTSAIPRLLSSLRSPVSRSPSQTTANPLAPSPALTYAGSRCAPTMPETESAPRAEYRRRADRLRERAAEAERLEETISRARLGVALIGLLIASLAGLGRLSWWWLMVPSAAFVVLRAIHARIRRRRRRAEDGRAFYERGLARLDGQWAGAGRSGARFLDPHHPYADDLDVFGEGSLYELLCSARTTMGEETLAAWLRAPADPATVRATGRRAGADTPPRPPGRSRDSRRGDGDD